MGRIKTKLIKRVSKELLKQYRAKFTQTFNENKTVLNTLIEIDSKKVRNGIAGYITRLMRRDESS